MMDRRGGDDRLGLAEIPVYLLEALQEAGQGAWTDGDMGSDPHVALSQLAGDDAKPLFGSGVFNPEKVLGQQLAKAAVNLADSLGLDGDAAPESPTVDPFLHSDVRLGFHLQVALAGILAVIVLERPLDVYGVRVMPFNEVGVVAVHGPHKVGERGQ